MVCFVEWKFLKSGCWYCSWEIDGNSYVDSWYGWLVKVGFVCILNESVK